MQAVTSEPRRKRWEDPLGGLCRSNNDSMRPMGAAALVAISVIVTVTCVANGYVGNDFMMVFWAASVTTVLNVLLTSRVESGVLPYRFKGKSWLRLAQVAEFSCYIGSVFAMSSITSIEAATALMGLVLLGSILGITQKAVKSRLHLAMLEAHEQMHSVPEMSGGGVWSNNPAGLYQRFSL